MTLMTIALRALSIALIVGSVGFVIEPQKTMPAHDLLALAAWCIGAALAWEVANARNLENFADDTFEEVDESEPE